jgi:hypothetical protein
VFGPLTNWPIFLTMLAAVALMMVRKPWKMMTAGAVLIGASLLEAMGAFFTLIMVLFLCVGTVHTGLERAAIDLVVLVAIAVLSMLTSWLALGWGVWHTIRTPREVFRMTGHA